MEGEWFRPEGEVLDVIELVKNGDMRGILELFEERLKVVSGGTEG